jgi:hypothetical protein
MRIRASYDRTKGSNFEAPGIWPPSSTRRTCALPASIIDTRTAKLRLPQRGEASPTDSGTQSSIAALLYFKPPYHFDFPRRLAGSLSINPDYPMTLHATNPGKYSEID